MLFETKKDTTFDRIKAQQWMHEEETKRVYNVADLSANTGTVYGQLTENGEQAVFAKAETGGIKANTLLIGAPNTGKNYGFIRGNLLQAARRGESLFTIDASGEQAAAMVNYCKKQSYNTYVLNFANPEHSDCWNMLDTVLDPETGKLDDVLLHDMVYTLLGPIDNLSGDFWAEGAATLLTVAVAFVKTRHDECTDAESILYMPFTMASVYKVVMNWENYDASIVGMPEDSLVAQYYRPLSTCTEDVRSRMLTTLKAKMIGLFTNKSILNLVSHDGINLSKLKAEKTACFIIPHEIDPHIKRITSYLIISAFRSAMRTSDKMMMEARNDGKDDSKALPLNIVLDEFPMLGVLGANTDDFPIMLSNCRKRNIGVSIAISSTEQIKHLYGANNALTIMACCMVTLFFGACDEETVQYLKDKLPMSTDEIRRWYGKPLMMTRGEKPLQLKMLSWMLNPCYKELDRFEINSIETPKE